MITLTERSKKIIFIIFFITFTIGTGYALYYFFFRPVPAEITEYPPADEYTGQLEGIGERGEVVPVTEGGAGTLPEAGEAEPVVEIGPLTQRTENVELLREEVTQAVSPDSNGRIRYYDPIDGRFYYLDENGNEVPLSQRQFYNVDQISWGNTKDEAIMHLADGKNIYYSFTKNKQVNLPGHWEDFEFSDDDSTVAAKSIGLDENNRYLITTQPDGNEATALYPLGKNADRVITSWSPNGRVIGFSKTGTPQPDQGEEIYLLGKNHEDYKSLKVAGRGFMPNWSPSGNHLLYSVYHERDNLKPMLWITDSSGDNINANRRKLNINTWADKCTWADEQTIYCAVPVDLPPGAGADPEYFSAVSNDIYRIDLTTGVARKVSTPEQKYPVRNPILSADKKQLIFTHAVNGTLYRYELTQ